MEESLSLQDIVGKLKTYWQKQGCSIMEGYDVETGAGTMSPFTFLHTLGPEPWKVAYVEAARRPADGRYGENPNRLYQHHQFQVLLKPSPSNVQELYLGSLEYLGIKPLEHDIRFVEDNWENPSLGCSGVGWEVWLDGMEITQFTYFQVVGGVNVKPTSVEITYGLERLASYIQNVESVWDVDWSNGLSYKNVFLEPEKEYSQESFENSNQKMLTTLFDTYESEARRLISKGLVYPAYDYVLKASHTFNLLDASGVVSVSERATYLKRIRSLAKLVANEFIQLRVKMGFPLIKDKGEQIVALNNYRSKKVDKNKKSSPVKGANKDD